VFASSLGSETEALLSAGNSGFFKVNFYILEEAFIWAGLETELERNLEKEKN
jgi:hypothetical protein